MKEQSLAGMDNLLPEAVFLVWILGVIIIGINSITEGHLFGAGMIQNYIITLIKIGAFLFIVGNWREIAIDVVFKSFEIAGITAGNLTEMQTPSGIFMTGFKLCKDVWGSIFRFADWQIVMGIMPLLLLQWATCLTIVLAFGMMAIRFFLTVIEFYVFAGLSIILVPFGMVPRFKFLFDNVISGLFRFGIKYMTMIFILGIGQGFFSTATTPLEADSSVDMLLKAAVSVILYMMIVIEIPNIVSAMIYGSPSTNSSAMGMIGRVAGKLGP
jgi:P-type conjugative transfer protein TrbL